MRLLTAFCCMTLLAPVSVGGADKHPRGTVPDSATAVKIAEEALIPAYGKTQIKSEEPFTATLENGIWTVSGTLHCPDGKGGTTSQCAGGTAEVKISSTDGHVIRMIHSK